MFVKLELRSYYTTKKTRIKNQHWD